MKKRYLEEVVLLTHTVPTLLLPHLEPLSTLSLQFGQTELLSPAPHIFLL
jgi:hypothetical protein